jgi:ribosomal protein S18 acetylase RimI-like enzyme
MTEPGGRSFGPGDAPMSHGRSRAEGRSRRNIIVRFATVADVEVVAALHADRIAEGFLVTLGPAFLRRLYGRIVRSPRAFVLVADTPAAGASRVDGFVAVADDTAALYREFVLHDGVPAGLAAAPRIMRAPRSVFETLRYGIRSDERGAEILATAVASDRAARGIGTALVRAAVDELRRRGARTAHVVTAADNRAAARAYERGGFRASGHREVHRGVAQQLLVWP